MRDGRTTMPRDGANRPATANPPHRAPFTPDATRRHGNLAAPFLKSRHYLVG